MFGAARLNNLASTGIDYGTYQGYFRSQNSTVLNAYNTAGTVVSSITHNCGTLASIRAKRIPGTQSHIVGVCGSTLTKFYRYTPGAGFIQLVTTTVPGRHCDITFDIPNNLIYMAATRPSSPFIQLYKASMSDTITSVSTLSTPATVPGTGAVVQSVVFSPDSLALAMNFSVSPYMITYTRSGDTFTAVGTVPNGITTSPDTGTGTESLSWNANGTALAYTKSTASSGGAAIIKWNGSNYTGTGLDLPDETSTNISSLALSFNPNPRFSNILLAAYSNAGGDDGSAKYYDYNNHSLSSTTSNSATQYQMEYARWSPDGLRVFLQDSATLGYTYTLNTSYNGATPIASLLTGAVSQTLGARGFDWMYY